MSVFITQEVVMRNRKSGELVKKFDISKAAEFGDVQVLLHPGEDLISSVPVVRRLRRDLHNFNDNDYLLLLGDPALIAAAAAIAAIRNNGRFKILKYERGWDPVTNTRIRDHAAGSYIPVQVDISGKEL